MNVNELQKRLREKERELWADMTRTEEEARASGTAETQDAAAESKESLFKETTADWSVYTQVRDALQRIEKGAYGKCLDCGRQIEDHRLASVPWAPYCFDHQNQRDRELAARPS
jgi:DnaK suppressor protein